MFKKLRLESKIKKCKKEITFVEQKRYRSQAGLVEAILTKTTPSDEDVDYFNKYTVTINNLRDEIREYQKEIDDLKKK